MLAFATLLAFATAKDPLISALSRMTLNASVPRTNDDWLYDCADVPACAGACAATLEQVADPNAEVTLCAALRPVLAKARSREWKALAAAWARSHLLAAARAARVQAGSAARDTIDCALARRDTGAAEEKACLGNDARLFAAGFAVAVAEVDEGQRTLVITAGCGELLTCAGGCAGAMRAATMSADEVVAREACPALAAVANEAPEAYVKRVHAYARYRVSVMRDLALALLTPEEQLKLRCRLGRAKLEAMPAACPP